MKTVTVNEIENDSENRSVSSIGSNYSQNNKINKMSIEDNSTKVEIQKRIDTNTAFKKKPC